MQSCASAAKLRSGGLILPIGMKAKGLCRGSATSNRHRRPITSVAVVQRSACVAAHGADMGWRGVQSQPILSMGRREANRSWQRKRKKLRLILRHFSLLWMAAEPYPTIERIKPSSRRAVLRMQFSRSGAARSKSLLSPSKARKPLSHSWGPTNSAERDV
jgi:hypothetical protein